MAILGSEYRVSSSWTKYCLHSLVVCGSYWLHAHAFHTTSYSWKEESVGGVGSSAVIVRRREAMTSRSRKKMGYNWKARQTNSGANGERYTPESGGKDANRDTNDFILSVKEKRLISTSEKVEQRTKRLSSKKKKRLQKILEAKEKKAKASSN